MPNQPPLEDENLIKEDETLITLEGDDGNAYSCQLIDVFEFEKQEYALLLKLNDSSSPAPSSAKPNGEPEEGSLVVMRLTQRDDQCIFQTIEDDKEFEKVISYIEELAQESLNETTDKIAKSEQ